jgi:hypothetical protein
LREQQKHRLGRGAGALQPRREPDIAELDGGVRRFDLH